MLVVNFIAQGLKEGVNKRIIMTDICSQSYLSYQSYLSSLTKEYGPVFTELVLAVKASAQMGNESFEFVPYRVLDKRSINVTIINRILKRLFPECVIKDDAEDIEDSDTEAEDGFRFTIYWNVSRCSCPAKAKCTCKKQQRKTKTTRDIVKREETKVITILRPSTSDEDSDLL